MLRSRAAITHHLVCALREDAELVERRARHRALMDAAANLGGKVGGPALALVDSEQARALLVDFVEVTHAERDHVRAALREIDSRIAAHIHAGADDATYLVAHSHRLALTGGIRRVTQQWARIDQTTAPQVLPAARALHRAGAPTAALGAPPRGTLRAELDHTVSASTPALTAATNAALGGPTRPMSGEDLAKLRPASFPSAVVDEATRDYPRRRPTSGGGVPAKKVKGKEPPTR